MSCFKKNGFCLASKVVSAVIHRISTGLVNQLTTILMGAISIIVNFYLSNMHKQNPKAKQNFNKDPSS